MVLRRFLALIFLLLSVTVLGMSQAQESTLISPSVFLRGLALTNGVRYTASFIKPTDGTILRNLSVEITLPADAQLAEMLVSRQVQFDVIRRNREGQLTMIWQISRVDAETPLDAFSFTLAAPLNAELEFYMLWQDEQGQTFVENFFELPSTLRADETEANLTPGSTDFALAGNTGIQVASTSSSPLNVRILANDFNPPAEYGQIWWCSLVELTGLAEGDSAMVLVPLRRPVAPFTELLLFQQQADDTWLALDETGIVTADGQFVMYRHPGGLMATGGDQEIQQEVVPVEAAVIEEIPPQDNPEAIPQPQNNEPVQSAPIENNTVVQVEPTPVPPQYPVETGNNDQDNVPQNNQPERLPTSPPYTSVPPINIPAPTQSGNITDGTSNTILLGEATPTLAPTRIGSISDGSSNTIILSEATPTPTLSQSGNITDGSSNTILLGEATPTLAPTRIGSISDGSSNTILLGEATPTLAATQSGNITDGSSNTILLGESTPTPTLSQSSNIADGSSNTILLGEATPTALPTRIGSISDGSSNTILLGEATPTPTLSQSSNITDGSSNTILLGETTATPAPTQSSSITDGSSNTILLSEATFTPTANVVPTNIPVPTLVIVPTQVIITIPPPFGSGGVRILIVQSSEGKVVQCQVGGLLCAPLQRRTGKGLR